MDQMSLKVMPFLLHKYIRIRNLVNLRRLSLNAYVGNMRDGRFSVKTTKQGTIKLIHHENTTCQKYLPLISRKVFLPILRMMRRLRELIYLSWGFSN